MERKFRGFVNLVVLIAFVGGILIFVGCAKKEPEEYKIGAILPLTGDAAQYGEWAKNGIELAVKEINNKGGMKVKIIYEDSQAQPTKGVSAMNKLVTVDKVPVVIGAMASSVTLAIAPIAQSSKTVLFSAASSSPELTKAGDFFFRNWPSDLFEGNSMAEFAYDKLGFRKIGIIYVNTDYGIGIKDVFKKRFVALGGEISFEEGYPQGESNFRALLTKIKNIETDALYIPAQYSREMGRLLKQAGELGIKKQVLSTVTFESQEILELAGEAAEGVIYTAPAFDPDSSEQAIMDYQEKYKSAYGKKSEVFAAHAYDAMNIIAQAIEQGGYSATGIKNALFKIKDYPGITGKTTFDENGDVVKPAMIKVVKDGKFLKYSEAVAK